MLPHYSYSSQQSKVRKSSLEIQLASTVLMNADKEIIDELISLKEACKRYDVSRPWLYKVNKEVPIFEKVQGRTFLSVKKFRRAADLNK